MAGVPASGEWWPVEDELRAALAVLLRGTHPDDMAPLLADAAGMVRVLRLVYELVDASGKVLQDVQRAVGAGVVSGWLSAEVDAAPTRDVLWAFAQSTGAARGSLLWSREMLGVALAQAGDLIDVDGDAGVQAAARARWGVVDLTAAVLVSVGERADEPCGDVGSEDAGRGRR